MEPPETGGRTKRHWNWRVWTGFLLVAAGLLTFIPIFSKYPLTRDVPWVNFLLMAAGLVLLAAGVVRAFRDPRAYRGRVFGPALSLLAVLGVAMFVVGFYVLGPDLPPSAAAPHAGQKAPDFTLPDQDNKPVALADLVSSAGTNAGRSNGALLIFYRGHW